MKSSPDDMPPGDDDPAPACGDRIRSPGEVCYKPAVSLAAEAPMNAQFADMDGDGDLDVTYLAVNGAGIERIHTRINANGVFSANAIEGAETAGPYALARDFDGDGDGDLAVAGTNPVSGSAILTTYKGDDTAHQTVGDAATFTFDPFGVGVGDVKGAGDMLVVFDRQTVILYSIASDLTLALDGRVLTSQTVAGTIGEVDGDPYDDAVAATYDGIMVMRGGPAGLSPQVQTPLTMLPQAIAVGDVTGDGIGDVAYSTVDTDELAVMPSAGLGTFLAPLTAPLAGPAYGLQLADLDGNGYDDVIAGSGTVQVVLAGEAGLADAITLPNDVFVNAVRTGDFNGDDVPDLVVTSTAAGTVNVYESNP